MELVKMGIPSATLFASSDQPPHVQEKIFMEIASGFTRILLTTPEKFIKNIGFQKMLERLSKSQGIQFVIDEAHCIVEYQFFRLV
jgi:superfamily II DNA helicase RecQ